MGEKEGKAVRSAEPEERLNLHWADREGYIHAPIYISKLSKREIP